MKEMAQALLYPSNTCCTGKDVVISLFHDGVEYIFCVISKSEKICARGKHS